MDPCVRAVVVQHAGGVAADPNELVPTRWLADALASAGRDPDSVGADYARLWARTFRTLARHLKGRPERTLSLLAEEVLPFLRGDPLAARAEVTGPGQAVLTVAPGLPQAWLGGFVTGFMGLSGARAVAQADPAGRLHIAWSLAPRDRLAGLMQYLSDLRVPLLVSAALGALVGIALAGPGATWWRVGLLLAGVLSVQAGANALHELRAPAGRPLGPPRPTRPWWRFQALGGYGVGLAAGGVLAWHEPWVLAYMAAGGAIGLGYPAAQRAGLGPVLAAFTYGPLVVFGTLHALTGGLASWPQTALASVPAALLAASTLYIDDLADRPLDEAGGKRTLLVRLPRAGHVAGYAALLGTATLVLGVVAWTRYAPAVPIVLPFGVASAVLVRRVQEAIDDPHALAPVRFATTGLQVTAAACVCLAALAGSR